MTRVNMRGGWWSLPRRRRRRTEGAASNLRREAVLEGALGRDPRHEGDLPASRSGGTPRRNEGARASPRALAGAVLAAGHRKGERPRSSSREPARALALKPGSSLGHSLVSGPADAGLPAAAQAQWAKHGVTRAPQNASFQRR